jgi:hypothetical protein
LKKNWPHASKSKSSAAWEWRISSLYINKNDDFIETTTPYDKTINLLIEHEWGGYLLSEYEGPIKDVPLVPDYAPTNRYSTKDGIRVGILIYSTTVKDPGSNVLSCDHPDGRRDPDLILAVGSNCVFKLFRRFLL